MSKNKYLIAVALALATGSLAFAAAQSISGVEYDNSPRPRLIKPGLFIGDETNALKSTTNKIPYTLGASATIDFASATITCRDSSAITVTGAKVGDPCFVGIPATLTSGGTGLHESFTCYVSAADNVKVRACAAGTADDPASVVFNVRVFGQ